eukprot:113192_1
MGVCESTGSIAENVEQHRYESAHRDTDNDQPTEREQQESKRKNSLQQKINVLTWTTQKINHYKLENNKLKATNSKLNEENGELKEYVSDQNNQLLQLENELKEMDYKMSKLERETIEKEKEDNAKYSNSIHDTLYKIPGDTVTKLKYSKQSAKYVIFINGINHLFYYEENNDNNKNKNKNNKSEPKCIVIRDINITNSSIKKHITKPWFLVIGTKRKALFITSTISLRNKWYNFICESLGKKHVINGHNKAQSTLSMGLFNSKHMREISEFQFKTIKFNYPSRITDCNIINNGHTIQININSNKCQLITDNNEIYQLKQFHFHIPSEHNISGKKYEMEMHLIHMNKKTNKIIVLCFIFTNKQKFKNPKLELNKSQTHLILPYNNINIFNSSITSMRSVSNKSLSVVKLSNIQETETDCDDSESSISSNDIPHFDINNNQKNENIFLKQFWDQLPLEKSTNNIPLKKPLNFEYLFKTSANNYTKHIKTGQVKINMQINEYIGELQIPPYTEGVKWYVSKNTHFISYKQLKTLKQIWYSYL